jgi:hypothetical protein
MRWAERRTSMHWVIAGRSWQVGRSLLQPQVRRLLRSTLERGGLAGGYLQPFRLASFREQVVGAVALAGGYLQPFRPPGLRDQVVGAVGLAGGYLRPFQAGFPEAANRARPSVMGRSPEPALAGALHLRWGIRKRAGYQVHVLERIVWPIWVYLAGLTPIGYLHIYSEHKERLQHWLVAGSP